MNSRLTLAAVVFTGAGLVGFGCASEKRARPVEPAALSSLEAPRYADAVQKYNQRVDRLPRIWARTVFGLNYTEEDGRLRKEQFEGHLQLVQPSELALSGGKSITDTLFWLGCDAERFWWFEMGDVSAAHVGRHVNVGQECAEDLSLPARPLDIIKLIGVTPLDPEARGRCGWSTNGQWAVIDTPTPTGSMHVFVDPASYEPGWIKLLDRAGRTVVFAELLAYDNVSLRQGDAVNPPRMATRVLVRRPDAQGELRLNFAAMSDGADRVGRLNPEAFRFESLLNRLRPARVDVLDSACPEPAWREGSATEAEVPGDGQ